LLILKGQAGNSKEKLESRKWVPFNLQRGYTASVKSVEVNIAEKWCAVEGMKKNLLESYIVGMEVRR